jgi:hypothetical protein
LKGVTLNLAARKVNLGNKFARDNKETKGVNREQAGAQLKVISETVYHWY